MKNFSRTGKILFSYGAIQMFWGLVMLNVNLFEHTSETIKYIILITGIVFCIISNFLKNIKVILIRNFMLTYRKQNLYFMQCFASCCTIHRWIPYSRVNSFYTYNLRIRTYKLHPSSFTTYGAKKDLNASIPR